jgi:hypothetical protein
MKTCIPLAALLFVVATTFPSNAQPVPLEVSIVGGPMFPVGMYGEFETWVIVDEETGAGEEYYFEARHVSAPMIGGRASAWPLSWLGLEAVGLYAGGSDLEILEYITETEAYTLDGTSYQWLASARLAFRLRPGGGPIALQFGAGGAMIGEPEEVEIEDAEGNIVTATFDGVTNYGAVLGLGVVFEVTEFLGMRVDAEAYGYERDQTATFFDEFSGQELEIPMFEPAIQVDVVITGGLTIAF